MISTNGNPLLQTDAVSALKTILIPLATIITPNLPEASVLLDRNIEILEDMAQAARDLAKLGCKNILLKGGHLTGEACDIFYQKDIDTITELPCPRINTPNTHGTGCTLSLAIAANLAKGLPINMAVKKAKFFITKALLAGADIATGKGHGPVHHFYDIWHES